MRATRSSSVATGRHEMSLCVLLRSTAVVSILAIGAAGLSFAQDESVDEPIAPIPAAAGLDPAKLELGEQLFRDFRLSHGNRVSCVSCHALDAGGDDEDQVRSIGADGKPLDFNTSTIFNAALSFRLNWRGNFRTLEEQNETTLQAPLLMNTSWEELLSKLAADPRYTESFAKLYGASPDRDNVLDALAAYQRSLVTPDARFDQYLEGDLDAITADEKQGYQIFKDNGCIACHQGVNIGGNLFQKFGIFADPFAGQKTLTQADLGRFAITGLERDRHVFRVPSLRNIAVTAPYFHDGRTASLEDAVKVMARNQLGRELNDRDIDLIVKFLGTLTGKHQGKFLSDKVDAP